MDTSRDDHDRVLGSGERGTNPEASTSQSFPDGPQQDSTASVHPLHVYVPQDQNASYAGYSSSWNAYSLNPDSLHVVSPVTVMYNENSSPSLVFHPGYGGFSPDIGYGQYSPAGTPLPPIMVDGQLYSAHQVPFSPSCFPSTSVDNMFFGPGSSYVVVPPPLPPPTGILGSYEGSRRRDSRDEMFNERNRGPRASKIKGKSAAAEQPGDVVTDYADAKFFVIKSFSEDNVHKSIKYKVWASTPHGNKKLDAAFQEAKERSPHCPVLLFFSVNASGQFCGVAEMVGPVDFGRDADHWQQDRWSGQFPVKWQVVKDVANIRFRHILLDNNDNKPVTHSRDSQEVGLKQGLEMLKVFKDHEARTCILDDFDFYDERERALRERKARQQDALCGSLSRGLVLSQDKPN